MGWDGMGSKKTERCGRGAGSICIFHEPVHPVADTSQMLPLSLSRPICGGGARTHFRPLDRSEQDNNLQWQSRAVRQCARRLWTVRAVFRRGRGCRQRVKHPFPSLAFLSASPSAASVISDPVDRRLCTVSANILVPWERASANYGTGAGHLVPN